MIGRDLDFGVDFAALLTQQLTRADGPIRAAQYRLLQGALL
jgi:hypothetical protein